MLCHEVIRPSLLHPLLFSFPFSFSFFSLLIIKFKKKISLFFFNYLNADSSNSFLKQTSFFLFRMSCKFGVQLQLIRTWMCDCDIQHWNNHCPFFKMGWILFLFFIFYCCTVISSFFLRCVFGLWKRRPTSGHQLFGWTNEVDRLT